MTVGDVRDSDGLASVFATVGAELPLDSDGDGIPDAAQFALLTRILDDPGDPRHDALLDAWKANANQHFRDGIFGSFVGLEDLFQYYFTSTTGTATFIITVNASPFVNIFNRILFM